MPQHVVTVTLNPAVDQTAELETLELGAVNRVERVQNEPGGKGVNVASFLSSAKDVRVTATGLLGQDNQAPFTRLFDERGIEDRFFRVAGRNRTNIKLVDLSVGVSATTNLNFPGFIAEQDRLVAMATLLKELGHSCDVFVLSGSMPTGLAVDTWRGLIAPLRAAGKYVVVDTSGPALTHAVDALPDVIKPNLQELSELIGRPIGDAVEAMRGVRELHERGLNTVIVSMGAEGAIFSNGEESCLAVPPQMDFRTAVGAGDAMVAGYTLGHMRGMALADAARLATAFSIGALMRVGPRLPAMDVVEGVAQQVQISAVPR